VGQLAWLSSRERVACRRGSGKCRKEFHPRLRPPLARRIPTGLSCQLASACRADIPRQVRRDAAASGRRDAGASQRDRCGTPERPKMFGLSAAAAGRPHRQPAMVPSLASTSASRERACRRHSRQGHTSRPGLAGKGRHRHGQPRFMRCHDPATTAPPRAAPNVTSGICDHRPPSVVKSSYGVWTSLCPVGMQYHHLGGSGGLERSQQGPQSEHSLNRRRDQARPRTESWVAESAQGNDLAGALVKGPLSGWHGQPRWSRTRR
jgi:hypothetical protein